MEVSESFLVWQVFELGHKLGCPMLDPFNYLLVSLVKWSPNKISIF